MNTSMFAQYVNKYFKGIVGKVTELFNGKKNESDLLYEQMLDEEYSADLTWNSSSFNHSIVAADVVSMAPASLSRRGELSVPPLVTSPSSVSSTPSRRRRFPISTS